MILMFSIPAADGVRKDFSGLNGQRPPRGAEGLKTAS